MRQRDYYVISAAREPGSIGGGGGGEGGDLGGEAGDGVNDFSSVALPNVEVCCAHRMSGSQAPTQRPKTPGIKKRIMITGTHAMS